MSKKVKAFVYNFLSFALFFLPSYYLIQRYGGLSITGYFIPITAFVVATLLAPKFQAVQTRDGEKLFMKWLLRKGVKEIK
jgi:Na+-driven multidrug efflux pump